MKRLSMCAALCALLVVPAVSSAQSASAIQTQIQTLLQQIALLQTQLGGIPTSTALPTTTSSAACPLIGRVLKRVSSGEDVKRLQQFLARDPSVYPEANASGFYGALTEAAVKRWQTKFNIVSSGTGATTGFGVAGCAKPLGKLARCSITNGRE